MLRTGPTSIIGSLAAKTLETMPLAASASARTTASFVRRNLFKRYVAVYIFLRSHFYGFFIVAGFPLDQFLNHPS